MKTENSIRKYRTDLVVIHQILDILNQKPMYPTTLLALITWNRGMYLFPRLLESDIIRSVIGNKARTQKFELTPKGRLLLSKIEDINNICLLERL